MRNTDVRFRNVIATLQRASLGSEVQLALADYDETLEKHPITPDSVRPILDPSPSDPTNGGIVMTTGWTGALPTLYISHATNVRDDTDPIWIEPPIIGPGDKLVDWDPNDPESELIDQDGNPVHV